MSCYSDFSISVLYPDSKVSSVINSNKSPLTNISLIKALYVSSADGANNLKFIPHGIKEKFPNLIALTIVYTSLLSVKYENLRQFGYSLEHLNLGHNLITTLDRDWLIFNTNIKSIDLSGNPLRHILMTFFASLEISFKHVEYANFQNAGCMNQLFQTSSGHNLKTFNWNYGPCNDRKAHIDKQKTLMQIEMLELSNNDRCASEKFASNTATRFESIDGTIKKLSDTFTSRLDSLNSENIKLQQQLNKITEDNTKLSQNLKNWMDSVDAKLNGLSDSINKY